MVVRFFPKKTLKLYILWTLNHLMSVFANHPEYHVHPIMHRYLSPVSIIVCYNNYSLCDIFHFRYQNLHRTIVNGTTYQRFPHSWRILSQGTAYSWSPWPAWGWKNNTLWVISSVSDGVHISKIHMNQKQRAKSGLSDKMTATFSWNLKYPIEFTVL